MKAAIFDAVGAPLRIADVPDPTPGPDEVVLRTAGCGICGSDLHITEDPAPFGIGAGFVSWVLLHAFSGRAKTISPLLWIVAAGFVIFFARGPIEMALGG